MARPSRSFASSTKQYSQPQSAVRTGASKRVSCPMGEGLKTDSTDYNPAGLTGDLETGYCSFCIWVSFGISGLLALWYAEKTVSYNDALDRFFVFFPRSPRRIGCFPNGKSTRLHSMHLS